MLRIAQRVVLGFIGCLLIGVTGAALTHRKPVYHITVWDHGHVIVDVHHVIGRYHGVDLDVYPVDDSIHSTRVSGVRAANSGITVVATREQRSRKKKSHPFNTSAGRSQWQSSSVQ